MIPISHRLYELVSESFKSKTWTSFGEFSLENEWHSYLISSNVIVETISGTTNSPGPKGVAEAILDLMLFLETGGATLEEAELDQYVACPDPMSPNEDFCAVLLFPKELAERVLSLGFFPRERSMLNLEKAS